MFPKSKSYAFDLAEQTFTYDNNGNRLSVAYQANPATASTYDSQDRILNFGQVTFEHSPNGEMTKKIRPDGRFTSYEYDVFGQLKKVVLPFGRVIEYITDGENRRVGKKINGVLTQQYVYDLQQRLVADLDPAGNVVNRYVYATVDHSPDYLIKGGVIYRYVGNQTGTVKAVVNTNTFAIAQQMVSDEFGAIGTNTNPNFQMIAFAGGMYDPDTGLLRFGARDYDPTVGRWTTKDPIGFAGGDTNLYAYVGGNPMSYVDPSGLTQQDLLAAQSYLRSLYPSLSSTNPTVQNFPLGQDTRGRTLTSNLVLINMGLLDSLNPPGSERIADYIQTLSHELMHTQDLNTLGLLNGYGHTISDGRHESITNQSIGIANIYRGYDTQCKMKNGK